MDNLSPSDPMALLAALNQKNGRETPGAALPINPLDIMKSIAALGEAAGSIEILVQRVDELTHTIERIEARVIEVQAITSRLEALEPQFAKLLDGGLMSLLRR